MAYGTRRGRSGDHSRSGRAVIWVQIVSWCAVGVLLILRGVTTLTNDDTTSTTGNRTTSILVETRDSNCTKNSREVDEYAGKLMLRTLGVEWHVSNIFYTVAKETSPVSRNVTISSPDYFLVFTSSRSIQANKSSDTIRKLPLVDIGQRSCTGVQHYNRKAKTSWFLNLTILVTSFRGPKYLKIYSAIFLLADTDCYD
jgi:hypothetical protein